MYPLAPDSSPRPSSERSLYAVKMSTALSGTLAVSCFVASSPSIPGMRTSMITTFGRRRSASATADSPSEASPITRMCGARESERRRPSRTTSWSSTMRHVISRGLEFPSKAGADCSDETGGGSADEGQLLRLGRRTKLHLAPVADLEFACERRDGG